MDRAYIDAAVEALIKHDPNGKINLLPSKGGELVAHDVFNLTLPYLSKDSQNALGIKTYSTVHQRNELRPGQVINEDAVEFFNLLSKIDILSDELLDLLQPNYTRVADKVMNIGFRLKLRDINVGLVRMAAALNAMTEKQMITACLAEPTLIPLHSPEETEIMLVCYVAINYSKEEYFNKHFKGISFEEGQEPRMLSKEI